MKIVISLGGSKVIPNRIDIEFLKKFKKVIDKIKKGNKIIIIVGGGSIARQYIEALKTEKIDNLRLSKVGYNVTKLNGMLVSNFLNANVENPSSFLELKKMLTRNNVVVTGSIEFNFRGTSDFAAVNIAKKLKSDYFINVTNVKGLFDKDPKLKNAKFIPEISFNDFLKIVNKIKFKPGQHFVLDQSAAKIINKNKIKTFIIKDISNIEKIINENKFVGTLIG